jgi:hypothetical protein
MHVPALQPNTAPNRCTFQSRNRLRPKPTTSENNTGKSAAVETPNQADFPPPDINQLEHLLPEKLGHSHEFSPGLIRRDNLRMHMHHKMQTIERCSRAPRVGSRGAFEVLRYR